MLKLWGSNVVAMLIVLAIIYAFYWATTVPSVWAWMKEPAHVPIVTGVAAFITNYAVKLSSWKGDDTLWNLLWAGIRKRLGI
jgi:hypothetical protein